MCYPNPINTGELKIESDEPMLNIMVFNMSGEIVAQKTGLLNYQFNLELSEIRNGFYTVKINRVNSTNVLKIIVENK